MLERGAMRRTTNDGRKIVQMGTMKRYRKLVEIGGAGGLE